MKIFAYLVVALIALLSSLSLTVGQVDNSVIVERGDTRLTIPSVYVISRRLGGVEHAKGLDSDEGTVLLRLPASEIQAVLPLTSIKVSDLIVSLRLLTPQEVLEIEQGNVEVATQIRKRSGKFSEAIVSKDIQYGWYRLHQTPGVKFLSYVLRRPDPAMADDVIAVCTKSEGEKEDCGLPTFVVHGVGVETSLAPDVLKYKAKISSYLATLIARWLNK